MVEQQFESQKNLRAGGYTLLVAGLLLVILLFVRWQLSPLTPPPPVEEGLEVNLGNSDQGLGTDQAFEPGPPAPSNQQAYVPPQPVKTPDEPAKDIETDDKDEDAPVIKKSPVVKPEATKIPEKEVVKAKPVANPKPETPPAPPVQRPKAVFKGVNGTGSGGNEASTYKKGGNEGIAGGRGDQGAPGGNPDSKNYSGGGKGNSSVRISKGLDGRYFTKVYAYQDDFNENATVAVDIRIDQNGNIISATYQMRGSTTSESFYKEKAIEIVKKSKANVKADAPEEQTGTVLVNFRVKG